MSIGPAQMCQYGRRHQIAYIASQTGYSFDIGRADIHPAEIAHEKDRLDVAAKFAVHQRHLKLVVKVRERAQTAQDGARAAIFRIVHQQTGKWLDFNSCHPSETFPGHLYPFFQRKKRGFQIVARYGHDNGIENFRAAGG